MAGGSGLAVGAARRPEVVSLDMSGDWLGLRLIFLLCRGRDGGNAIYILRLQLEKT